LQGLGLDGIDRVVALLEYLHRITKIESSAAFAIEIVISQSGLEIPRLPIRILGFSQNAVHTAQAVIGERAHDIFKARLLELAIRVVAIRLGMLQHIGITEQTP